MNDLTADFIAEKNEGGCTYLSPDVVDDLSSLNLFSFQDWMTYTGGHVVDRNRKRSVVQLRLKKNYFLKRFSNPPFKDFLGPGLFTGKVLTHARREADAALALLEAGIGSYSIVGLGEAGRGWTRPSFLITVELTGFVPLCEVIAGWEGSQKARARQPELRKRLAELVRRMHLAGITHPDLYATHIFISREDDSELRLIDLHRVVVKEKLSLFHTVRDLTGLHLSCVSPHISRTDRIRFLLSYFGREKVDDRIRRTLRRILKRAGRIGGRNKFKALAEACRP